MRYRFPFDLRFSLLLLGLIFAAAAILPSLGCNPTPNDPSSIYIQNTNTNIQGGAPSPSPDAGGALPPGSSVPVFTVGGGSCPSGGTAMPNSGTLKLGCSVWVTCTPKGPDGVDLSEAVHGPNVNWNVIGAALRLVPRGDNPFNQDAIAQSTGFAAISCTVKGLPTNRPLELQVVP